ncbi:MAG TPA: membrane protein insertase YidC [Verrucomicrobiales bacterium]|jgi:YidC/Oxa1 family membrane protein insertase|nr:membrane protein insertase YidC [Verrucomicrobiales bacterium]
MDRTSWIGVIVCLSLLFVWGWWNAKESARIAAERPAIEAKAAVEAAAEAETKKAEAAKAAVTKKEEPIVAPAPGTPALETAVLENDLIRLNLTNRGGGIQYAEMKNHRRYLDQPELIRINETSENAVGAFSPEPDQFDTANWKVVAKTASSVSYESTTPDGIHYRKTYSLPGEGSDPYEVQLEIVATNPGKTSVTPATRYLYTGSAAPLHLNEWSMQIGSYWMGKDGDFQYETVDHFGGKKAFGIFGKDEIPFDQFPVKELHWAGVNDQFFTTTIEPETPYEAGVWISRFPVVVEGDKVASEKKRMFASEAAISLPKAEITAGASESYRYQIYLGPKEFARLKSLGDRRQRAMHYDEVPIFGWLFGWAIKPIASVLITGLVFLKGLVGNYGYAIILITILIRLLIWPVYAKSSRSMKRMSKLTPLMKDIKEKHSDNPQKMNEETMKLYKTYGINPLGGCLPMFIQLPVFLAFYRMLWSAVELRHENFLWVHDLAMPDTVYVLSILGGQYDVNPLPILMGITSFIQIAITPKTGDKTQQMIFMFMPLMFIFICYNFASALALYWTTSNAFSILQTWLMNKMPEPELIKKSASGKKGMMQRLQDKAEAAQEDRKKGGAMPTGPGSRTKMPGEKGDRHSKGKKKRK